MIRAAARTSSASRAVTAHPCAGEEAGGAAGPQVTELDRRLSKLRTDVTACLDKIQ